MINNISGAKITAILFITLASILILLKFTSNDFKIQQFLPSTYYDVTISLEQNAIDAEGYIKTFIPKTTTRQSVEQFSVQAPNMDVRLDETPYGKEIQLKAISEKAAQKHLIQFCFEAKNTQYTIPEIYHRPVVVASQTDSLGFLASTELVQADHPKIIALAKQLTWKAATLPEVLEAYYQYVFDLEYIQSSVLTDALGTFENQAASCNGKARLFVALCRAAGIQARLVGGLILEDITKKTSHQWAEVWIAEHWVPFDVTNGHFAGIPANYVELYKGDAFLFKHYAVDDFDYAFTIKEKHTIPNAVSTGGFTFSPLFNQGILSVDLLKILLTLPFCALLIALFKNIVGLKTFGTFLPALIAIALASTGLWFGIFCIFIVLLTIGLLNILLEKWGILYTPKLVIMLLTVIVIMLSILSIGVQLGWLQTDQTFYIPIVILAILAERFAQTIVEEDLSQAFHILGQTILVTLACYGIYCSDLLMGVMICFPELFLVLFAISILLGNWIGLRLSEYRRFQWIAQ